MSIIGPRPLMARYLDYYTEEERKRHNVRPGLSGYILILSAGTRNKIVEYFVNTLNGTGKVIAYGLR